MIQTGDVTNKIGIPTRIIIKKITNNTMYPIKVIIKDSIPNNTSMM
jgi:hypothetical protein